MWVFVLVVASSTRGGRWFRPSFDDTRRLRRVGIFELARRLHGCPKGGRRFSAVTGCSRKRMFGKAVASGAMLASRVVRHFGGGQRTEGNLWSVGESPESKKPKRASGQPVVATRQGSNGLHKGQAPEIGFATFLRECSRTTVRGERVSVNQAVMSG